MALDTWFTGDISNDSCIEHYHNANCPCDDRQCRKLCLKTGLSLMLRKPPLYSRRSWHGQNRAVDEIVLMVSTHGLLRLAGRVERRKPRPPPTGGAGASIGAPKPDASAEATKTPMEIEADRRETLHQQAAAHAQSVSAFLLQDGHKVRMLQYQQAVHLFTAVRGPVLMRAGPEWEAEQLVASPDRTYGIILAKEAEDIRRGMALLIRLAGGAAEPPGTERGSACMSFCMAARGAGAMWELGLREQQRYPAPLFSILKGGPEGAAAALEACEDAEERPHLLGSVSASYIRRYNSASALVSQEALVCLESQALLISETTQRIERGHAEVKRGQRCREQTHLERTAMASALRVLRLQRCDVATTVPRRFRHRGSQRTDDPQAPDPSRRPRANDTRGRRRKRRKPSLWQAWVSLSGEGWVERNAGRRYRPAIAQPHIRKRCQQRAEQMLLDRLLGRSTRAKPDRRLRTLREKARGRGARWSVAAARAQLEEQDREAHVPFMRRKLREWQLARATQRRRVQEASDALLARPLNSAPAVPVALQGLQAHLVPHQAVHSDAAFWWHPEIVTDVMHAMPAILACGFGARVAKWQRSHSVVDDASVRPCAPAPAAETARSRCASAGVCLCFGKANRRRLAFTLSWRQALTRLLRREEPSIRLLRGPNEMRAAADEGRLILEVSEAAAPHNAWLNFYYVCFIRYSPCRPVLLRLQLVESAPDVDATELDVRTFRAMHTSEGHWFIACDTSAYLSVDEGQAQMLVLHHVFQIQPQGPAGVLLQARPFRRSRRCIWQGSAAPCPELFRWEREPRRAEPKSGTESETSDTDREEAIGAPDGASVALGPDGVGVAKLGAPDGASVAVGPDGIGVVKLGASEAKSSH